MIQVFHYTTRNGRDRNGRDPFGEWLSKQNINVVARIQQRIDRMRRGNFGDHRGLDSGLSELRIDYGPGYRVYYGRDGHNIVILLAGGTKKSQDRDIEQARIHWKAYKQEKRNARKRT